MPEKQKQKQKPRRKQAGTGDGTEAAVESRQADAGQDYETEGPGAEEKRSGDEKKAYVEEQRRRESKATDVDRAFPAKYRLSGEMEGCSDARKLELFERLVVTREFDARMRKLFRQGRFEGTFYSQIGQEACDVVICWQMEREDFVGPSHRDLGASTGKGIPLKALAAQVYNRVDSPDGGRYTACHYWHPDYGVMQPATSIAMNWVTATGAAFGFRMLKKKNVAVAFCGDGATAHGDFHEACNFAGVHNLPIVYIVQNNLWAESLPVALTTALTDLSHRADAFGFPGVSIDGNDVVKVYNTTREALDRARRGDGPTLIEMKTYRWFGHSDIDPADYRSDEEVRQWMERDPLPRYEAYLRERGVLDVAGLTEIQQRVRAGIEEAIDFAEASARPEPDGYFSHVYAEEYPGFEIEGRPAADGAAAEGR
ncbi:MAG TPA: thiamine pyrophosphate-dependent dehydrogenase E1 component subunit alpha [Gemmatimonadota bacterium]|nr:thiamine pyrophosphate-dependent dehydrogenase E1 component subunit alpha [Gemmatimonadota bacterium]